jgi:V8-like Glu-specific endopeptidase
MSAAVLLSASLLSASVQPKSICSQDERIPSQISMVGSVTDAKSGNQGACTITLVGDSCALTAGHCLHVLGEAEFLTDSAGRLPQKPEMFRYSVDKSWVRALQSRIGNDWAVVRLRPNALTGLLPGKVHGFVDVQLTPAVQSDSTLEVHAISRTEHRFELLKGSGRVLWLDGSIIFHDLDTGAGSSGALLIDSATGRAVGIHTHGGCETMKNNKATYIALVPRLVTGIRECEGH